MRRLDTRQFLDETVRELENGAEQLPVPIAGFSMAPFLADGDTVFLSLPGKIRRGDVVLYLRPGGRYVLHRVKKIKRGVCTMIGDAQSVYEYGISASDIKAAAVGAVHRGKKCLPGSLRWRFYSVIWLSVVPFRKGIVRLCGALKRGT